MLSCAVCAFAEETEPEEENDTDILVVCFSATGHTKPLAEYAAEYLGADFYEIEPEEPYTDYDLDYNDSESRTTIEQNDDSCRPGIANLPKDLGKYQSIIIAHPIWWGQAPKIIYTFLESFDFSGKTLTSMCTSASSSLGTSAENLQKSAEDAEWLESRRFPIGAEEEEVTEWLDEINIGGIDMNLMINDEEIPVIWENNDAVAALAAEAEKEDITVEMSMYGGWEQVGSLGVSLPTDDTRITAVSGDIMLYTGDQIVLFYGENTWSYTKLGRMDLDEGEAEKLLSSEDVTVTISAG